MRVKSSLGTTGEDSRPAAERGGRANGSESQWAGGRGLTGDEAARGASRGQAVEGT